VEIHKQTTEEVGSTYNNLAFDIMTKGCNQLTPYSRVLLQKLIVAQLINKFLAFYGTHRFIFMFTIAQGE
jgi:hypothetical protein